MAERVLSRPFADPINCLCPCLQVLDGCIVQPVRGEEGMPSTQRRDFFNPSLNFLSKSVALRDQLIVAVPIMDILEPAMR